MRHMVRTARSGCPHGVKEHQYIGFFAAGQYHGDAPAGVPFPGRGRTAARKARRRGHGAESTSMTGQADQRNAADDARQGRW